MLDNELPAPEWKQSEEVGRALVRVTLRNSVKQRRKWVNTDLVELLGAQIAQSLSEDERRLLNYLAEVKTINVTQAVRVTGGDWSAMKRVLLSMEKRGILEWVHRKDLIRDSQAHFRLAGGPPKAARELGLAKG